MDEIAPVLDRYPPDCRPIRIDALGAAGGMSGAKFWRITSPRGTLMLRRWPPEHPTRDRLRFIHAVIRHAAQAVDFLPVPIQTLDGQSDVHTAGHLWELAPWMPGVADYELAPSDEKLRTAMTALAQFHSAVANFESSPETASTLSVTGPPAIPRRLERLRKLSDIQINGLFHAISDRAWPELAPLAREFVAELPNAIPRAMAQLEPLANIPLPFQPCLRDIWHDHVLFTGNQVTGLIDFGAVDIDTPATDIARLVRSLIWNSPPHFGEGRCDVDPWQTALTAYSAVRPISPNESLAVFAIDAANPILAGWNWIQWVFIEHRQFENPQQIHTRFQRIANQLRT